jgi:hypothetical protein
MQSVNIKPRKAEITQDLLLLNVVLSLKTDGNEATVRNKQPELRGKTYFLLAF